MFGQIESMRQKLHRANLFSAGQRATAKHVYRLIYLVQRLLSGRRQHFSEWTRLERSSALSGDTNVAFIAAALSRRQARALAQRLRSGSREVTFITCYDVPARDELRRVGLSATDLKDLWTSTELDISIHEETERLWREMRNACPCELLRQPAIDLLRLSFVQVSVTHRRIYAAVSQLFKKKSQAVVLIAGSVDEAVEAMLGTNSDFDAVVMRLAPYRNRFYVCPAKRLQLPPFPSRRIRMDGAMMKRGEATGLPARIRGLRFLRPDLLQVDRVAKQFRGKQPAVVIAIEMQKDSIYWPGTRHLVQEFRRQGVPILTISSLPLSRPSAASLGMNTLPVRLSFSSTRQPVSKALYGITQHAVEEVARRLLSRDNRIDVPGLATLWWVLNHDGYKHFEWLIDMAFAIRDLCLAVNAKGICILPHHSDLGLASAFAARMLEVPTVSCPLVSVEGNSASLVGWEMLDYVASYGKQCTNAFQRAYGEKPRLLHVGNIRADVLRSLDREDSRRQLFMRHRIAVPSRIVLVATSHIDPDEISWLKTMASWCAQQENVALVIKVHPSFPNTIYAGVMGPETRTTYVLEKENIGILMVSASVCITDYSTVGVDAVLLGKPLVVMNTKAKSFPANDYVRLGVAWPAATADALTCTVAGLLRGDLPIVPSETKRMEFMEQFNWPNEGSAARKLVGDFVSICDEAKEALAKAPPCTFLSSHEDEPFTSDVTAVSR